MLSVVSLQERIWLTSAYLILLASAAALIPGKKSYRPLIIHFDRFSNRSNVLCSSD